MKRQAHWVIFLPVLLAFHLFSQEGPVYTSGIEHNALIKDSSLKFWQQLVQDLPGNDTCLYLEAVMFYKAGMYDSAGNALRSALSISPFSPSCRYLLALSQYRIGLDSAAMKQCDTILIADSGNAEALLLSGFLFGKWGNHAAAILRMNSCLQTDPSNMEALVLRANESVFLKKYTDALRDYSAAQADCLTDAAILNNIGICYFQTQAFAKAIPYFEKALRIDKKLPEAYYNLGISHFLLQRPESASTEIIKAEKLWQSEPKEKSENSNSDALFYLGLCRKETGDINGALTCFLQLQKLHYHVNLTVLISRLKISLFISKNWYYLILIVFINLGLFFALADSLKSRQSSKGKT